MGATLLYECVQLTETRNEPCTTLLHALSPEYSSNYCHRGDIQMSNLQA